ncbi:MAG: 3-phosphoshikimate 1-carboxyvinyltransferase, partial [Pygmaiobacter sp.]
MNMRILPGRASGTVVAPPSKSVAHRALIAAALCGGTSVISNVGDSEDIAATLSALQVLGAQIERHDGQVTVTGCDPKSHLGGKVDCNESGSTLRFLIPLFALGNETAVFTGKGRLLARPQDVYAELFKTQGLPFCASTEGIALQGPLMAGDYALRGDVSSQFVTGLLFALPLCAGASVLRIAEPFESRSYVKLTLEVLGRFGIRAAWIDKNTLKIFGNQRYQPTDLRVEGDYSGAAFFGLLGALSGAVDCRGLCIPSAQGDAVFFELLRCFGAR